MTLYTTDYIPFVPSINWPEERSDNELWFIFKGKEIVIKQSSDSVTIPCFSDLKDLKIENLLCSKHYLGKLNHIPCFCGELLGETSTPEDFNLIPLKDSAPLLGEEIFHIGGKASQIIDWNNNFKFCGRCGSSTEIVPNERAKKCPKCGLINYPTISPAIIVAITRGNEILLAHNKNFPTGLHSLIAGFVEPSETLEHCVKREILEEVGIKVKNIKYFGSQPWPFPNSTMICFFAEYESGEIKVDGEEILSAGWFTKDNLPQLPAPHTIARKMINSFLYQNVHNK